MGVHDGDINPELILDLKIDITNRAANFPIVRLKKPDDTYLTRDYGGGAVDTLRATVTDEENGLCKITFVGTELVGEAGTWDGQAKVDWSDGGRSWSDVFTFDITANLT